MFIYIIALVVLAVTAYFLIRRKKTVNYVAPALSTEPTEEAVIIDRMRASPEYRSTLVAIPTTEVEEEVVAKPKRVRKPPAAKEPAQGVAEPAPAPKPKRKAKPKPPTAQE